MKTQLTISIHLPASVPTLFLPVLWMESPCCYLRPYHCSCTETHPLLCIHRNCSRNRSLFCSSSLCYTVITPVLIKPSFDSTPFTTTLFLHLSPPNSRKFLGGFVFCTYLSPVHLLQVFLELTPIRISLCPFITAAPVKATVTFNVAKSNGPFLGLI